MWRLEIKIDLDYSLLLYGKQNAIEGNHKPSYK